MNENKDNNKKRNSDDAKKASEQLAFPAELSEVDGFIADMLERHGADVGDSLFRDGLADLLGASLALILDYLPDECHTAGHAVELLEDCTWSYDGQIRDAFNLLIHELMCGYRIEYDWDPLAGEQLPYLKPSPLTRNSDGMRPSDSLSFGLERGFLPDEDETLNRYCRFIALVPDPNMRMSVRYAALALLKYSFPNEDRLSYSIRNIIDDLG